MPISTIDVTRLLPPKTFPLYFDTAQEKTLVWTEQNNKYFELWGLIVSSVIDGEVKLVDEEGNLLFIALQVGARSPIVITSNIPMLKRSEDIYISTTINDRHSIQVIGYEI